MYIPPLRTGGDTEVVLWDTATDSNYVRLNHAKAMRFPYKMETVVVQMVGGRIQKKVLPVYKCLIKDLVGKGRQFFVLGLKEITRDMFCSLTRQQLCNLFPGDQGVEKLGVKHNVDFMIGLDHGGWQPQRVTKAAKGGDLWIWSNEWGQCIGGRHPWIN